ncbi:hypothetical protein YTPLAS18_06110 [Nitrospira sp.]|nr:hypothetical protein YTPLAS18_06110 [Nitrospira sp.]
MIAGGAREELKTETTRSNEAIWGTGLGSDRANTAEGDPSENSAACPAEQSHVHKTEPCVVALWAA